jgi:GntR family transcriptional regulator
LQAGLEQLESFRSLAAQAGVDEERGQWEVELAVASRQVAELLALSAGAAVVRVFMTATSNKLPFAYLKSFVPADRVEIEKLRAYAAGSLLDYLTESDQPPISFTHSRINAVPADPETADRLQVAPGRPLLRLAETFFAESGQPLSFSLNYFVTDLVEFHLIRRVVAGRDARGGRAAAV